MFKDLIPTAKPDCLRSINKKHIATVTVTGILFSISSPLISTTYAAPPAQNQSSGSNGNAAAVAAEKAAADAAALAAKQAADAAAAILAAENAAKEKKAADDAAALVAAAEKAAADKAANDKKIAEEAAALAAANEKAAAEAKAAKDAADKAAAGAKAAADKAAAEKKAADDAAAQALAEANAAKAAAEKAAAEAKATKDAEDKRIAEQAAAEAKAAKEASDKAAAEKKAAEEAAALALAEANAAKAAAEKAAEEKAAADKKAADDAAQAEADAKAAKDNEEKKTEEPAAPAPLLPEITAPKSDTPLTDSDNGSGNNQNNNDNSSNGVGSQENGKGNALDNCDDDQGAGNNKNSDPLACSIFKVLYRVSGDGEISGTVEQSVKYTENGTSVTAIAHEGSHFVGWSDGVLSAGHTELDVKSNVTITATFALNELPKFDLTYNANGGSGAPATFNGNGLVTLGGAPAWTDHTFLGWKIGTELLQPGAQITLNEAKNAVAQWEAVVYFTLSYNSDGGTSTPDSQRTTASTSFAAGPSRPSYTFLGWNVDGTIYRPGQSITLTANKTAVASWSRNAEINNGGGNDNPPSLIERIVERIITPVAPVVEAPKVEEPKAPEGIQIAPVITLATFGPAVVEQAAAPAPLTLPTSTKPATTTSKALTTIQKVTSSKIVVVTTGAVAKISTAVYFDMNKTNLDETDRKILRDLVSVVKSKISATSKVTMEIVGWVQPTKVSPNVDGLSNGRAKATLEYLKSLGMKSKIRIVAPGEGKSNVSTQRQATVDVTMTDVKQN